MGDIKDLADEAFRDMESPGSTTPHEPVKSEIRGVFDRIDADVEAFEGVVLGGRIEKATYAALAAIVPGANGTAGAVLPTDGGTHTDPVVGGTVDNAGVYSYSTSPAGWERIGDYQGLSVASQSTVDDGTDNSEAVTAATLRNAVSTKRTIIWLEYVSGAGNAMVWRPLNPLDKLTGDATQYRFRGIMPFDSIASTAIAITQYDGTPFIASLSVRMPDGTSQTPAGGLKQGDLIDFGRNHVPLATNELGIQGLFRLYSAPGYGTSDILPTAYALDIPFGLPVSDDKRVALRQTGDNTYVLTSKLLYPDHYDAAVGFSHGDVFRATIFDMKDFQSNVSGGALCLNSFGGFIGGVAQMVTNLQFTTLMVLTTDTGQVPSTFEPPFFVLNDADPDLDDAVAAGIGHGFMVNTTCSIVGTEAGVDTELYDTGTPVSFTGDKVVTTVEGFITTKAGDIVASLLYTDTYEPTADYHTRIQVFYDFGTTAQEVTPATTGAGSYSFPVPIQNCNRIVGFLNGVRVTGVGSSVNGIHIIDLKDTTITNLGIIDEAIAWNSDYPEDQTVITNLIGPGMSCKIDGTPQVAAVNSGVQNNVWGAKLLGTPIYNLGATKLDITGKTFEFDYGIRKQRKPAIT